MQIGHYGAFMCVCFVVVTKKIADINKINEFLIVDLLII